MLLATLLPLAAAAAAPGPTLLLGELTVALDASLPRAASFGFGGHGFPGGRFGHPAAGGDAPPPPHLGGAVAAVVPPAGACASTKAYCPRLANCFQRCADEHLAPYCYAAGCCPSRSFGAWNISSLGFYECKATPCLANCTAVFAKGLPPVPPLKPPSPSPHPHPPPPPPAPPPLEGVTLVQVGGRRSFFAAGSNLTTTWAAAGNGSSATWRLALGTVASATGAVHLVADSDGHGSPAFHWSLATLTDHGPPTLANQTRWVELGFGFASVAERGGGYTIDACHSGKRPALAGPQGPDYTDWSWTCGARQGSVSGSQRGSAALGVGHYAGGWSADGAVGWGAWSSQRSAYAAIEGRLGGGGFTAGISRVDVRMRCGSVLPFDYRIGFFNDSSLDGKVDATDVIVWNRRQFPEARSIYKTHLVWKLGNDYHSCRTKDAEGYTPPVVTFNETLEWVKEMSLISGGMPQIVYMVGWQGTGHDTLYPSLDVINGALGTKEDLHRLVREAKVYNATISYHLNTDEAYVNYSEYARAGRSLTYENGLVNEDVNDRMLALNPDGSGYEWGPQHVQMSYDPLQGPAYHVSKTKDFVSGQRIARLGKLFDTVPVGASLHCDAWRDINLSYENTTTADPWGWIHENEEMRCGCEPERALYESHGVSFGVEGPNGMSSDVRGLVDYYWHVGDIFGVFGKIVGGGCNAGPGEGCCAMGCSIDGDYSPGCTEAGHPNCVAAHCAANGWACSLAHVECCGFARKSPMDWYVSADDIYMKTRMFQVFLTDEMVDPAGRFANGGTTTSWPLGGGMVALVNATGRLLPAINPPPASAGPRARATIDASDKDFSLVAYEQACAYRAIPGQSIPTACPARDGPPRPAVVHTWGLPLPWHGRALRATTLTPNGTVAGPLLALDNEAGTVTLAVTPGWPVTLTLQAAGNAE
jgi:hypothetical protein